ncbi:hypothetical protein BU23DRAFT_599457 [Bimuria novae-zelandiae CBS 107.79]|uniref:Uncharacterized protein n=1 Tax=Bimuria novae-zelandiae CBS 107.79 TaxID=1447943 RepID=A0A6A5V6I9_9PLEO|nr:hypothetical protein BU23DRAFT_599457 [Bimuria novae-zelandiae CBS 107.79]
MEENSNKDPPRMNSVLQRGRFGFFWLLLTAQRTMGFLQRLKAVSKTPKRSPAEELVPQSILVASKSDKVASTQGKSLIDQANGIPDARTPRKLTRKRSLNCPVSEDANKRHSRSPAPEVFSWSDSTHGRSATHRPSRPLADRQAPVFSNARFPPPLPLDISEGDQLKIIHQNSSLDQLASGYNSGSSSPDPGSIFGSSPTRTMNTSPASTISLSKSEHGKFKLAVAPPPRLVDPAFVPAELDIKQGILSLPAENVSERSDDRLTLADIERMRAALYTDSEYFSDEEEVDFPSALEPGPSLDEASDPEASKGLLAVLNQATADLIKLTERLHEVPAAAPQALPSGSSARKLSCAAAPFPDVGTKSCICSSVVDPAPKTSVLPRVSAHTAEGNLKELHSPHLPLPDIPLPSHPARPPATDNETPVRSDKWWGKQPQRCDSFGNPSDPLAPRRYTRPNKHWYATRERFMEIFDEIPTIEGGARRENPKLYQMRKRRTLLEIGLTERDLLEAPTAVRGEEIMLLLDALECRLQREREEENARKKRVEERDVGPVRPVRKSGRAATIGAHCANDARIVYSAGGTMKGKIVERRNKDKVEDSKGMSMVVGKKSKEKVVGKKSKDKVVDKKRKDKVKDSKGKGKAVERKGKGKTAER